MFKKNIQRRIKRRTRAGQASLFRREAGNGYDRLDTFPFMEAVEDPATWEETTQRMFSDARADPAFQKVLEEAFLEEDMEASFRRCMDSRAPEAVLSLLRKLGVDETARIADVGAGRSHFAYALSRLALLNITVMEPNDNWFTGTGYLQSLDDHDIEIVNSVEDWRKITCRFDAIISYATVHHWQHISKVMIDLRVGLKINTH